MLKKYKYMLVAIFLLVVLLVIFSVKPTIYQSYPLSYSWWTDRHDKILKEIAENDKYDIVFAGDSLTHFWEGIGKDDWEIIAKNNKIINLGFMGDEVENLLWRLENGELPKNAKFLILLIGTNNIRINNDKQIPNKIKNVVKFIKNKLPNTKILLLSIPYYVGSDNKNITKINKSISKIFGTKYIDIANVLIDKDGKPNKKLYNLDGLHFSSKGYEVIREILEKEIK